jgi:hypothetical protein
MTRNARFWVYVNGWVRLTLRPGQHLAHVRGGPTDEGWRREVNEWTHDGEGVQWESFTEGRDCDGRHEAWWESYCPLDDLHSRSNESDDNDAPWCLPAWGGDRSGQRDYTAEAAGY